MGILNRLFRTALVAAVAVTAGVVTGGTAYAFFSPAFFKAVGVATAIGFGSQLLAQHLAGRPEDEVSKAVDPQASSAQARSQIQPARWRFGEGVVQVQPIWFQEEDSWTLHVIYPLSSGEIERIEGLWDAIHGRIIPFVRGHIGYQWEPPLDIGSVLPSGWYKHGTTWAVQNKRQTIMLGNPNSRLLFSGGEYWGGITADLGEGEGVAPTYTEAMLRAEEVFTEAVKPIDRFDDDTDWRRRTDAGAALNTAPASMHGYNLNAQSEATALRRAPKWNNIFEGALQWGSSFIGRGIASLYVQYRQSAADDWARTGQQCWTQFPPLEVQAKFAKFVDPRIAVAQAHGITPSASWHTSPAYYNNPALIRAHILMNRRGVAASDIDYTSLVYSAWLCNQTVVWHTQASRLGYFPAVRAANVSSYATTPSEPTFVTRQVFAGAEASGTLRRMFVYTSQTGPSEASAVLPNPGNLGRLPAPETAGSPKWADVALGGEYVAGTRSSGCLGLWYISPWHWDDADANWTSAGQARLYATDGDHATGDIWVHPAALPNNYWTTAIRSAAPSVADGWMRFGGTVHAIVPPDLTQDELHRWPGWHHRYTVFGEDVRDRSLADLEQQLDVAMDGVTPVYEGKYFIFAGRGESFMNARTDRAGNIVNTTLPVPVTTVEDHDILFNGIDDLQVAADRSDTFTELNLRLPQDQYTGFRASQTWVRDTARESQIGERLPGPSRELSLVTNTAQARAIGGAVLATARRFARTRITIAPRIGSPDNATPFTTVKPGDVVNLQLSDLGWNEQTDPECARWIVERTEYDFKTRDLRWNVLAYSPGAGLYGTLPTHIPCSYAAATSIRFPSPTAPGVFWDTSSDVDYELPHVVGTVDGVGINYEVTGLPAGVIFDQTTHRLTGRPTAVGDGEVRLTGERDFLVAVFRFQYVVRPTWLYMLGLDADNNHSLFVINPMFPTRSVRMGSVLASAYRTTMIEHDGFLYSISQTRAYRINPRLPFTAPSLTEFSPHLSDEAVDPEKAAVLVDDTVWILSAGAVHSFSVRELGTGIATVTNHNINPPGGAPRGAAYFGGNTVWIDEHNNLYSATGTDIENAELIGNVTGLEDSNRVGIGEIDGNLYLSANQSLSGEGRLIRIDTLDPLTTTYINDLRVRGTTISSVAMTSGQGQDFGFPIVSNYSLAGNTNVALTWHAPRVPGSQTGIVYTVEGIPAGLTFNQNAHTITGTVTTAGSGVFNLIVTRGDESVTERIGWIITTRVFRFTQTTLALEFDTQSVVDYNLPRIDNEPGGTTYVATGLPPGVIYEAAGHRLTGTPTLADTTGTGTLTATEGGNTAVLDIEWEVAEAEDEEIPVVIAFPQAAYSYAWNNGTAIDIELPRVTGSQESITYGVVGLPAGLMYVTATHRITGTPTTDSTGTAVITATHTSGSTDTAMLNWTVRTLVIIAFPGVAISYDWNIYTDIDVELPRTTPDLPAVTYSVGGLPAGLTYNQTTHRITGRPTIATTGTSGQIILNAVHPDSVASVTLPWTIAVIMFADDSIDFVWQVNMDVDYDLPRAVGNPIGATYSVSGLPAGIVYETATHRLTGTPTMQDMGTATLTVTAGSSTDTISLNWDVGAQVFTATRSGVFLTSRGPDRLWRLANPDSPSTASIVMQLSAIYSTLVSIENELYAVTDRSLIRLDADTGSITIVATWSPFIQRSRAAFVFGDLIYIMTRDEVFSLDLDDITSSGTVTLTNLNINPSGGTADVAGATVLDGNIYWLNRGSTDRIYRASSIANIASATAIGSPDNVASDAALFAFGGSLYLVDRNEVYKRSGSTWTSLGNLPTIDGISRSFDAAEAHTEAAMFSLEFTSDSVNLGTWHVGDTIDYNLPRIVGDPGWISGLVYSISGLPAGVTRANHELSGSPTTAGTGTAILTATYQSITATVNLVWTVALEFANTSIDIDAWPANEAVDYDLPRVTGEPSGTTYAVTGLPDGLTFNSGTHDITGTPTTAGEGSITLTATFGTQTATATLNWEVEAAAPTGTIYAHDFREIYRVTLDPLGGTSLGEISFGLTGGAGFGSMIAYNGNIYLIGWRIVRLDLDDVVGGSTSVANWNTGSPTRRAVFVFNNTVYAITDGSGGSSGPYNEVYTLATDTNWARTSLGTAGFISDNDYALAAVEHNGEALVLVSEWPENSKLYRTNVSDFSTGTLLGTLPFRVSSGAGMFSQGSLYISNGSQLWRLDDVTAPANAVRVSGGLGDSMDGIAFLPSSS